MHFERIIHFSMIYLGLMPETSLAMLSVQIEICGTSLS